MNNLNLEQNNKEYRNVLILAITLIILFICGAVALICLYLNDSENKPIDDTTTTKSTTTTHPVQPTPTFSSLIDNVSDLDDIQLFDGYDETMEATLTNDKFIFKMYEDSDKTKETKKYELDNIKSAKFDYIECMLHLIIVIQSKDNEVWYIEFKDFESPKLNKLNNKYDDIKVLRYAEETCGSDSLYLAIDSKGNYYDILTEKEFDKDIHAIIHGTDINIKNNGDIYVNNSKQEFKYVDGIVNSNSSEWFYIIDEDRYLYKIDYQTKTLKRYSDSKFYSFKVVDSGLELTLENGDNIKLEIAESYEKS